VEASNEAMTSFAAPLRLRALATDAARKVTWLELFFDLIFVAAVAQVAEPLREHYSVAGVVRFTLLFALIWWAWTGATVFATRFDGADGVQRALTLVQIFVVAAMAANAGDELDTRSSAGFTAAYAALRLVLVAQYFRARHLPRARPFTTRYIVGHGLAAVIWLSSALVPAPSRYVLWTIALIIDFGTPWLALPHSLEVPPDGSHLPERFGLFTLILLGEAVVAVMHGMKSHEAWPPAAAISAFLAMGLLFLIWWWYFDGVKAASERHVRGRTDTMRFHVWTYAHFPLYVGLVVTGVGAQRIVTAASREMLPAVDSVLGVGGACLATVAMAVVAVTSQRMRSGARLLTGALAISAASGVAGVLIAPRTPAVLLALIAAVYWAQVAWSTGRGAELRSVSEMIATAGDGDRRQGDDSNGVQAAGGVGSDGADAEPGHGDLRWWQRVLQGVRLE
jgi:low temperature requirement protein LtrA